MKACHFRGLIFYVSVWGSYSVERETREISENPSPVYMYAATRTVDTD